MEPKTKILVFIDWFLPAYKAGGPVRSIANMVNILGDDFDFYIVAGNKEFGESNPMKNVVSNQWVKNGKANVIYLSDDQINKSRFNELFSEVNPSIVYLNSLFSAKFSLLPLRSFKAKSKETQIVLAPRGMFGKESLKIKAKKKKVFLLVAKLFKLFKNITWHASTQQEKEEIEGVMGSVPVKIAPNLPFLPAFQEPKSTKKVGSIQLISVGRIVPIKNILFKLECLLELDNNIDLKIKFIGPIEDQAYFESCEALVRKMPDNIQVEFLGELPHHKIEEHYLASDAYISATLNENFGHGIVEAFGYSCPVIISDKTPWKNLEQKEVGFDLALDKRLFIDKIAHFAHMNQEEFKVYKGNARKFAENLINEQGIVLMNQKLFQIA